MAQSRESAVPDRFSGFGPLEFPEASEILYEDVPAWFMKLIDVDGVSAHWIKNRRETKPLGPEYRPWIYHGETHRILHWPTSKGVPYGTNMSKALSAANTEINADSPEGLIQILNRNVRLPGTASDYHFLLQRAVEWLWKHRNDFDNARDLLIQIASTDVELADSVPEFVFVDTNTIMRLKSVERLAAILEEIGEIQKAYDITVWAAKFDQLETRRSRLAKKLGLT